MPTSANVIPGEGTLFQIEIATVLTTVALCVEVNGLAVNVAPVDTTVLESLLHTRRPSYLPDPQELTAKIFYDPNDDITQVLLQGDAQAPGTIRGFGLIFRDGMTTPAKATFDGFVTKFELNGLKVEENIGADVGIQVTSLIDFTPGSGT